MSSLIERDRKTVWHPYSDKDLYGIPVPVASASGSCIIDQNGKKYIDAISSWWTTIHGHSHPHIAECVGNQLKKLDHVIFSGFTHEPAVVLAGKLLSRLPSNQSKLFFSDNGSTAVEVALKMAIQYGYNKGQPRKKVLAFKNSYHGDTFGAMSVSERGAFTEPFRSFLFDVDYIDVPLKGQEATVLQELKNRCSGKMASAYACFIFEPLVLGTAGMLMYEPGILSEMLAVCRENSILTIADEVMTGFGRTGTFFACDQIQEKPDLFCLSKGLTGGTMAMGITSSSADIYESFERNGTSAFFHGHSYTANPIACAAAIGSLEVFERTDVFASVDLISRMHSKFASGLTGNPKVVEARSKGTILAIQLKTSGVTSYFNDLRKRAYAFFISKGILMRPLGNIIYVLPPYCISESELKSIYASIEEFLTTL